MNNEEYAREVNARIDEISRGVKLKGDIMTAEALVTVAGQMFGAMSLEVAKTDEEVEAIFHRHSKAGRHHHHETSIQISQGRGGKGFVASPATGGRF